MVEVNVKQKRVATTLQIILMSPSRSSPVEHLQRSSFGSGDTCHSGMTEHEYEDSEAPRLQ
jgi:hypothetical protein